MDAYSVDVTLASVCLIYIDTFQLVASEDVDGIVEEVIIVTKLNFHRFGENMDLRVRTSAFPCPHLVPPPEGSCRFHNGETDTAILIPAIIFNGQNATEVWQLWIRNMKK